MFQLLEFFYGLTDIHFQKTQWRQFTDMPDTKVKLYSDVVLKNIKDIKPNDYNPNFMSPTKFEELKSEIKKGFDVPIIITSDNVIIDGEHRWKALKQLGGKQIPCIIRTDLKEGDAELLTINHNRVRGFLTPQETGEVLQKLNKKIPIDALSNRASMPQKELLLLMNMKYDPLMDVEIITNKGMSWAKVDSILNRIMGILKTKKFDVIYYHGRGGMVPARLLADRLSIEVIQSLNQPIITDGKILFIDDIYDTGKTHKIVSKMLKKQDVTYCYLYERKGVQLPDGVITGIETEGEEYVVFPWDKNEFRLSQKSN